MLPLKKKRMRTAPPITLPKKVRMLKNLNRQCNTSEREGELLKLAMETVFSSTKDELTGVFNRSFLQLCDKLEDGYVLMIDFDLFKPLNDTYGHLTGDDLLKSFSDKVASLVGFSPSVDNFFDGAPSKENHIIRLGGDEFLVFVKEKSLIQKINALNNTRFYTRSGWISLNFSLGITPVHSGTPLENLIESADKKMYENKRRR